MCSPESITALPSKGLRRGVLLANGCQRGVDGVDDPALGLDLSPCLERCDARLLLQLAKRAGGFDPDENVVVDIEERLEGRGHLRFVSGSAGGQRIDGGDAG